MVSPVRETTPTREPSGLAPSMEYNAPPLEVNANQPDTIRPSPFPSRRGSEEEEPISLQDSNLL